MRKEFKIKSWKSYWMKREPELYKQWEVEAKAKKKAEKKASYERDYHENIFYYCFHCVVGSASWLQANF